ncbi:hypothetical protein C8Q80DRAFT_1166212, partial [Daedaleopsis nitida]
MRLAVLLAPLILFVTTQTMALPIPEKKSVGAASVASNRTLTARSAELGTNSLPRTWMRQGVDRDPPALGTRYRSFSSRSMEL